MCMRGGKFCARAAMKLCHQLGYTIDKSVRDESGVFHLFRITTDTGEVLYFDFKAHLAAYLQDKRKNS